MAPHHPSPNVTCSFFLRLCSEVPILEDTLMRILVIGLSRELPLGPADAMELADHLVKRAAAVQADGNSLAPCPSPSLSSGVLPPAEPVSCLSCCGTSHTHTPPGAVPDSCPTSFQLPMGWAGPDSETQVSLDFRCGSSEGGADPADRCGSEPVHLPPS